jgi:hypothetical protein
MKKHRESIFKAFTIFKIFTGTLCVLFLVSIAEATHTSFDKHSAKGGMPICLFKLKNSVNDLKTCNTNLADARTDLDTCNNDLDQAWSYLGNCNNDLIDAEADLESCNADLGQAWADMETCNAALSACESNQISYSEGAPVAKTGQVTSYTAGDDGDLQMGAALTTPRFVDNGDGTVTDNLTGLIWMKDTGSIGTSTWGNAVQSCSMLADGYYGLSDGSYAGDWRLPNARELYSLVDLGHFNHALPDGNLFVNVMSNYWSSTTYAGNLGSAVYLNSMNGFMSFANKSSNVYVLCVRN